MRLALHGGGRAGNLISQETNLTVVRIERQRPIALQKGFREFRPLEQLFRRRDVFGDLIVHFFRYRGWSRLASVHQRSG